MNIVVTPDGIGRIAGDAVELLDLPHPTVTELLGEPHWASLLASARVTGTTAIRSLRVPVRPRSFWLVGSNYPGRSTCAPEAPAFYLRSASSVSGPDELIGLPRESTVRPDAELAVVIGRPAYRISEARAWEMIAGITGCNDLTARERLDGGKGVAVAKSHPGFGALGASVRIVEGETQAEVRLEVGGETRQCDTTASMFFSVAELISRLSHLTRLEPGDVVATGSPAPVVETRLASGDSTTVTVNGVHPLSNRYGYEEEE